MSTLLLGHPFLGEPWDTPPKDPSIKQLHKLISATGQIGEPAIQKFTEYIQEHPDELDEPMDANGFTPVIIATMYSCAKALQLLIDHGADVDIQIKTGTTAVNFAVIVGNDAICKILIDAGADLTIKNYYGEDAFDNAINNPLILELLNNAPNNPVRLKALQQRHSFSLGRTSDPSDYMTVDI